MKTGLYKASFKTPIGQGNGVVVVSNGLIRGGDGAMYYVGTYQIADNQITSSLRVRKHSNSAGGTPVFGKDDVTVTLQGAATETSATVQGTAAEAPGILFHANLELLLAD